DIFNGDFTIEGWMNPVDVVNQGIVFDILTNGASFNAGLRVYVVANQLQLQGFNYGGTNIQAATAITANIWHHFAVVRYGSLIGLFLDGIPVWGLITAPQTLGPFNGVLRLG